MEAMPDDEKRKVKFEYPCPWVYKIIGTDADEMRRAVV
jgi:putative lipoic acid-binding regulatory protein